MAMLMARLMAVNVLPSPGSALVTSTRFPFRIRAVRIRVRVLQDRTFQNSKFIGYLRLGRVGRDEAKLLETRQIDFHAHLGPGLGLDLGVLAVRQLRQPLMARVTGALAAPAPLMLSSRTSASGVGMWSCRAFAPLSATAGDRGLVRQGGPRAPQFLQSLGGLFDQAHRWPLTRRAPRAGQTP